MKRPGRKQHGTKKVLGLVMVVGLISAATYAFTAGNTVPDSNAGDGQSAVSGYNVTDVAYHETDGTDTNPLTIERVSFVLDGAANRVRVQLNNGTNEDVTNTGAVVGDQTWYGCDADTSATGLLTGETAWTCSTDGYLATEVSAFRVLAYLDGQTITGSLPDLLPSVPTLP